MERRKLFSSSTSTVTKRRKLFSENEGGASQNVFEGGESLKRIQCRDCGFIIETAATTTDLVCPKCGSKNRFNVLSLNSTPAVNPEAVEVEVKKIEEVTGEKPTPEQLKEASSKSFSQRKSLFGDTIQKEFSEPSNEFEEKLKEYSGKILKEDEVQKIFSCTSDELEEKGFAKINEETGDIKVNNCAFLQSKLFSKLIISVTKVLDLPPIDRPKEEIIEELAEKHALPEKGIILIKKAHRIPSLLQPDEINFSSKDEENEAYLRDSGIIGDLRLEFGGSSMGIKEFTKLLDERYDDAPENIIDILIDKGVIKIQGNQVDILK